MCLVLLIRVGDGFETPDLGLRMGLGHTIVVCDRFGSHDSGWKWVGDS